MAEVDGGYRRRWAVLALVLVAECMDLLDGSIVNVAAPTIRNELRASTAALQWIISGYALAFAIGAEGYVGTGAANSAYPYPTYLKDFWAYDPAADSWTQKADFAGGTRVGATGRCTRCRRRGWRRPPIRWRRGPADDRGSR